jgi:hypothetical protein
MTEDRTYNTRTTYSTQDADGRNFVDKHMLYMSKFPTLDCEQYILNLKLMTRR